MNRFVGHLILGFALSACGSSSDSENSGQVAVLATAAGASSMMGGVMMVAGSPIAGGIANSAGIPAGDAPTMGGQPTGGIPEGGTQMGGAMPPRGPSMTIVDGELERVIVETWMQGVPSVDRDPLAAQYERGEIEWPEPTEEGDENGVRWWVKTADENGTIQQFFQADGYMLAQVALEPGERLVGQADRASGMWSKYSTQPGDFYGSGKVLLPLLDDRPQAVVAVRGIPQRGAPTIKIFKTTDEVVFNMSDRTMPDLRVGHDAPLPLGIAILNMLNTPLLDARATVVENEYFKESTITYPGLAAGAVTQVAFQLEPKATFAEADIEVPIRLRLESDSLQHTYERTMSLTTIAANATFRQTFISPIDKSVQYYGVVPPTEVVAGASYSAVLSLHGASVEAINQARSYSAKDWTYIFAPTNRRPFGFDWEEWGRLNALAALDNGMEAFKIDPTKVYLTGHSMGGHGTWHVGVTTPGRFATLSPSAGWESFYSYGGSNRPSGPIGRARAHSDTLVYLSNIANRGVYILHGDADDNVPVTEGRNMFAQAQMVTDDVVYFEQPGVGHWWDGDESPGVDCVDWPAMFEFMQTHAVDPNETDFTFLSPSPSYAGTHSFVTLQSAINPNADIRVTSRRDGNALVIETENMRSMTLDGDVLNTLGIASVTVDGNNVNVAAGAINVGPTTGKTAAVYGPFNQAFRQPFCYIYPTGHEGYKRAAAYQVSFWSMIGNGHACTLSESELTDERKAGQNLIRMGSTADIIQPEGFQWTDAGIKLNGNLTPNSGLLFVQPEGNRLSAGLVTTPGMEYLIRTITPFSSRGGMPDFLIWSGRGLTAGGLFDNDWSFDASLSVP